MKKIIVIILCAPFAILAVMALGFGVSQLQLQWAEFPMASERPTVELLASEDIPTIVTQDPDGGRRITQLWIAAADGRAYIRTGDSLWHKNLLRTPSLELRVEGLTYVCAVGFVESAGEIERAHKAFHTKYAKRTQVFQFLGVSTNTVLSLDCGVGV